MGNQLTTLRMGEAFKNTPAGRLPNDWECGHLGAAAEIFPGGTPDRSVPQYWDGSVLWATPTDVTAIVGRRISTTKECISDLGLKNSSAVVMPPGSILMTTRAAIGHAVINTVPMATKQGFANIICGKRLHNYFLLYLLHSKTAELRRLSAGSAFLEIPRAQLKKLPIPIPPFKEQLKIAEILSAVDDVIEPSLFEIEIIKQMMRDVAELHLFGRCGKARWETARLRDLLREPIRNGYSPLCPDEPTGLWTLSSGALSEGGFGADRLKSAPLNDLRVNESLLSKGDLLVSRSNTRELVGMASLYEGVPEQCMYPDLMMRVRVSPDKIDAKYLQRYMVSARGRKYFRTQARGTSGSMVKINGAILADMPIPLPPLDEQRRIVDRLAGFGNLVTRTMDTVNAMKRIKESLVRDLLSGQIRPAH